MHFCLLREMSDWADADAQMAAWLARESVAEKPGNSGAVICCDSWDDLQARVQALD